MISPPSYQQGPLWFLHQLDEADTAYNIGFSLRFEGQLQLSSLQLALKAIVGRHDTLRSVITNEGGKAEVVVRPPSELDAHLSRTKSSNYVHATELAEAFAQHPFDMAQGPLYRFLLIEVEPTVHLLACAFQHVVFDGGSVAIFLKELSETYKKIVLDDFEELEPLKYQYSDFIKTQQAWLEGEKKARLSEAWKDALQGVAAPLVLPSDFKHQPRESYPGAVYRQQLTAGDSSKLKTLAKKLKATPFITLMAAFQALLARYTDQEDVVVGSPMTLRMNRKLGQMIGLLVNTVLFRASLDEESNYQSLVEQAQLAFKHILKNYQLPFSEVVRAVAPDRVWGHNPLFQVMFIYQGAPEKYSWPNLEVDYQDLASGSAKFDLSCSVVDGPEGFEVQWEYRTDLFGRETIERLSKHYERLLKQLILAPERPLREFEILSEEEQNYLQTVGIGPRAEVEAPLFLERIYEQVKQRPEALALTSEKHRLNYLQLWQESDQLAEAFSQRGVGAGDIVALQLSREPEFVVAVLAAWKLGAQYLPLDSTHPQKRRETILEDAQPCLLIQSQGEYSVAELLASATLCGQIESQAPQAAEQGAYLIYTSGSTGRPKGVQVTQRNLANLLEGMQQALKVQPHQRWLALTTFSFDISLLELFLPLSVGAEVILASEKEVLDPHRLARHVDNIPLDYLQATPSSWRLISQASFLDKHLVAISGGEALDKELARTIRKRVKKLFNAYGPTETTIWSCLHEVTVDDLSAEATQIVSIGQPILETECLVVDKHGRRQPLGVPGELLISGLGVTRGYLGRPELTEAAFDKKGRYRTGDQARLDSSGQLDFLGRIDSQVKLRGFRIELGEIEALLRKAPGIKDAAVVINRDALWAYLVAEAGALRDAASTKKYLTGLLPEYMLPAGYYFIERIPKTDNAKIDRKSLVAPPQNTFTSEQRSQPTNEFEVTLVRMFEEVLGQTSFGVEDSFFDRGGHSIKAVELSARIEAALHYRVPVIEILRAQTPRNLAQYLKDGGAKSPLRSMIVLRATGSLPPLLFVGSALLAKNVLQHLDPEQPVYCLNIFGLTNEDGRAPENMTVQSIAAAFLEDVLAIQNSGPYQICGYCADSKVALELAVQLRARGKEVGFLGTIDGVGPAEFKRRDGRHLGQMMVDFGVPYLRTRVARRYVAWRRLMKRYLAQAGHSASSFWPEMSSKLSLQHDLLYANYHRALDAYRVPNYPGQVTLFLCSEFYRKLNQEAWQGFAQKGVRVLEVPGFHHGLFQEPWVRDLGLLFRRHLADARR